MNRLVHRFAAAAAAVTVAASSLTAYSASEKPRGDISGDGVVNITDVSKLAAHVKGAKPLKGDALKAADISGDGKVDIMDVSLLAAHVKGVKPLTDNGRDDLYNEAKDKLDTTKLDNKTIKFFSHWDINPAKGQVVSPDLQLFQDVYDGKIQYVQTIWENRYTDLAKLIMSNNSPDFFSAMDMDGFPKGAIKAMFQPVDDYIDLDSKLWAPAKATNDAFVFGNGHYVAGVQSTPQYMCVYNPKTIKDNGLEDPAKLYWNDEWTWSKFSEMCIAFTNEEEQKVGMDGWWYAYALNNSCGVPIIGLENGKLVNNMQNPRVEKVQNLMYELQKKNVFFDRAANNWSIRGDGTTGYGMATGETLFYPVGTWAIDNLPEKVTAFGSAKAGEIMFVPMPRMDDSDTYYVDARVDGFYLIKNAPNPEGFAAFMNCHMAAVEANNELAAQKRKLAYEWTDDMLEMYDEICQICNDHPLYDFSDGISEEMRSVMMDVRQSTVLTGGGAYTWTATVASYKSAVDYLVEEANSKLEAGTK